MTIRNANSHPYQVEIVKDGEDTFYANSHPFKVAIVGGGGGGAEARVVDELPETGEVGYIYLVLKEHTASGDIYDEWIWALQQDGETYAWEHLGTTSEVTIVLYDTTGTNTDGAMTQNATTSMVYADPATKTKVQIGNSTSGGQDSSVSIGTNITAGGNRAIAIGERTDDTVQTASGASAVSIGVNTASVSNGVAIGVRAKASGTAAVALGTYPEASGQYSFAMHYQASASGDNSVAVGANSSASATNAIALGQGAEATAVDAIAIGQQTDVTGKDSVALGALSTVSGDYSVALGDGATASAYGSVALGDGAYATQKGQLDVGDRTTRYIDGHNIRGGYNDSAYRLVTGLYDPQSAHDAATKGYTDNLVISYAGLSGQGAPTSSTAATYLGQFYYDTTNDTHYYCSEIVEESGQPDEYVWQELSSGGSGLTVLTSADYNYPENTPTSIAMWLLEPGDYMTEDSNVLITPDKFASSRNIKSVFTIGNFGNDKIMQYVESDGNNRLMSYWETNTTTGARVNAGLLYNWRPVVDNLTSTSTTSSLTANQGKVLKDLIDGLVISGAGAPTDSTVGTVGQLYEDTTNGDLYICTKISSGDYTWEPFVSGLLRAGDGKIGVNNKHPYAFYSGKDISGDENYTVVYSKNYSGTFAPTYLWGNRDVGDGVWGWREYRLALHSDIPSVVQVAGSSTTDVMSQKAVTDMMNGRVKQNAGAPSDSTVGTVGQLLEDTTNGKLYICTAVSGGTYTWSEVGSGGGSVDVFTTNEWNALWA